MSELRHPESIHQPGSAPGTRLTIAHAGSAEPFFDPKNPAHTELFASDVNHILLDKRRTGKFDDRIIALASLTLTTFGIITESTDASFEPHEPELAQLHQAGTSLKADSNAAYLLELIDETVEPVEAVSPIAIAKAIKRMYALHNEPAANVLLTKLWVLQRMDVDMPTDYLKHLDASPPAQPRTSPTYAIVNTLS